MIGVLDIDIEIPYIIPPTITTTMLFLMTKVLNFLRLMEDMDIYILITATFTLSIMEFIIVTNMLEVYTCIKRPANFPLVMVEFIKLMIKVVKMVEVDISLNILATLTIAIMDQYLMLMGEMDIGLIQATISPITQVAVVNCWVSNFILVLLKTMSTKMR